MPLAQTHLKQDGRRQLVDVWDFGGRLPVTVAGVSVGLLTVRVATFRLLLLLLLLLGGRGGGAPSSDSVPGGLDGGTLGGGRGGRGAER